MADLNESGALHNHNEQEPETTSTRRDLLKTAWVIPAVITMGVAPGMGHDISGEPPDKKHKKKKKKGKKKKRGYKWRKWKFKWWW